MTLLLVFLAIAVLGLVALFTAGRLRRVNTDEPGPADVPGAGLTEPDPRLPPVLLPEDPGPDDVGRLRMSVALRGYRMDQVDAVLAHLSDALGRRDTRIHELELALAEDPERGRGEAK